MHPKLAGCCMKRKKAAYVCQILVRDIYWTAPFCRISRFSSLKLLPARVDRYPAEPPRPRLNTILGVGSGSAVPPVMQCLFHAFDQPLPHSSFPKKTDVYRCLNTTWRDFLLPEATSSLLRDSFRCHLKARTSVWHIGQNLKKEVFWPVISRKGCDLVFGR